MRVYALAALVATSCTMGCAHPTPSATTMPLRTLRLYETGVGYFERRGTLPTNGDPSLVIPSGHLDDALKTLVVFGAEGKRSEISVEGVEFGSRLSGGMARAMAGLPMEEDAPVTYDVLLRSLVGSEVAIETPTGSFTGRLVHVDGSTPTETSSPKDPKSSLRLTLLERSSRVMSVDEKDVLSVHPTDPAHARRLDTALEALLAHGAASQHRVRILGHASGPVTLGYIAETPVWRATYRVVLSDSAPSTVQGWALVHNDTDEAWRGVQLELVNGRPDSFLFPLAAPRYARRELAKPNEALSTIPQLANRTTDSMWGDGPSTTDDETGFGGLGTGSGQGYGGGSGIIHTTHVANVGESSLLSVGNLADVAGAKGTESGALFVYRMPKTADLGAHASALVPFLQSPIQAEPITSVEEGEATARSGVRLVNSTSQTLPAGTISVFADGRFAGESALERLRPGETVFPTFGVDLDIESKCTNTTTDERVEKLDFVGDRLEEHFRRTKTSDWELTNRSGSTKKVYIKLQMESNGTIAGADGIDFDRTSHTPMIFFGVPAGQTVKRRTVREEGLVRRTSLSNVTASKLERIDTSSSLAAGDKSVLSKLLPLVRELETATKRSDDLKGELEGIDDEIAQLREDAKALGSAGAAGSSAQSPTQPLSANLAAAEGRRAAVRKELATLKKDLALRSAQIRTTLTTSLEH